ncbi:NUDIX domain-containing protein [Pseudonocardiaceae bacterium YIM PH 21723]|nr:NUDIX domain-containing protein [Pseudonocardiaceae bacterium YIM PH 21723]
MNDVLHADALTTLDKWIAPNDGQEALRQAFLAYLDARPDAMTRGCAPGHLTASTLVLDAIGEHVLLTLHPRVGRWLQLGGHCEDLDESLLAAARREAIEESGIPDLRFEPSPLHLDVHGLTCSGGVPTRHLDVRFVARAPLGAEPLRSAESIDLQWWPIDALPSNVDSVPELIRLAQNR